MEIKKSLRGFWAFSKPTQLCASRHQSFLVEEVHRIEVQTVAVSQNLLIISDQQRLTSTNLENVAAERIIVETKAQENIKLTHAAQEQLLATQNKLAQLRIDEASLTTQLGSAQARVDEATAIQQKAAAARARNVAGKEALMQQLAKVRYFQKNHNRMLKKSIIVKHSACFA